MRKENKKILELGIVLALIILSVPAIYTAQQIKIRKMVRYVHSTYPAATLQDVYKTCYQDFWGAEHMVPDSAAAAQYLQYELEQAALDTMLMPEIEPCGWRHHYTRESLACVLNAENPDEEEQILLQAFLCASSGNNYTLPLRKPWLWRREWRRIERIALRSVPEWHDAALEADLRQAADQCAAVRHSPAFREAYHPHYRIVIILQKKDLFLPFCLF